MVDCYEHVIQSTESVRRLVGESSATSFQLNERQCGILAEELVDTCSFLEKRNVRSKFVEGVGCISLQHLCSAVNRAEVLVKKCCCRDLESWLVAAMMLVEIQEEFLAIILDIHLWRNFLDFAITRGRALSREEKSEYMIILDEEYHELSEDLRRETHALQRAAVEDKKTIISSLADLRGSTNGLDHLRAIFMQSWLTGGDACRDVDLKKYEYVDVLGTGGCGTVLKVKWLGVECALKVLLGQDEKEATALKGLFHPNIIRLFHYWEDRPEDPQSRLLMELMPKDLGAYMREQMKTMASPFSLPVAIDIMYQIAQAMRYMNEKRLTHRDLKPANILVKERPKVGLPCIDGAGYLDVKLADFGLVKSFKNTSTFQAHSRNKGTGLYRAPEVFGKDMALKRNYLPLADVWSFGITCAEILSGKDAYAEYGHEYGLAIPSLVCKKGLRPTLPKDCPPYLAFCIKSCWEFLPTRRPTFSVICKLLRHAKLLSLGVTKLDDSKSFFAYTTRRDHVKSLNITSPSSRARVSTFFQSSLKLMRIGPRPVPNVAEAPVVHEVRHVPPPLIPEDGLELNEEIGGGMGSAGGFSDGERHSSPVLSVADVLHEELVVSTPMVTEESSLTNEHGAGSVPSLDDLIEMFKPPRDRRSKSRFADMELTDRTSNEKTPVKTSSMNPAGEIGGGMGSAGGFNDGERHFSPVLSVADVLHEELVVSTPMVTEESSLTNEHSAGSVPSLDDLIEMFKPPRDRRSKSRFADMELTDRTSNEKTPVKTSSMNPAGEIGGGMGSTGGFSDGERHFSPVLSVADVLHEEFVVSTPMVTEERSLTNEHSAGSISSLDDLIEMFKPPRDRRRKNRFADMELTDRTSNEKTPVKTSSKNPAGETLSAKTAVNLHTPEPPVHHRSSPWSLEPSERCRCSYHYGDHYPSTMSGVAVSGDLAVRDAGMYFDARRECLSPGSQESFSRSDGKSRYEGENFLETYPVSYGYGPKMAAPATGSSNHFLAPRDKNMYRDVRRTKPVFMTDEFF